MHLSAITLFPSRYAVAHCSYATLHSRDRATEQPDNLLAYSMQIEEQISWPYVEPVAGWKLCDIIEIAHTQCWTRQLNAKQASKHFKLHTPIHSLSRKYWMFSLQPVRVWLKHVHLLQITIRTRNWHSLVCYSFVEVAWLPRETERKPRKLGKMGKQQAGRQAMKCARTSRIGIVRDLCSTFMDICLRNMYGKVTKSISVQLKLQAMC